MNIVVAAAKIFITGVMLSGAEPAEAPEVPFQAEYLQTSTCFQVFVPGDVIQQITPNRSGEFRYAMFTVLHFCRVEQQGRLV